MAVSYTQREPEETRRQLERLRVPGCLALRMKSLQEHGATTEKALS